MKAFKINMFCNDEAITNKSGKEAISTSNAVIHELGGMVVFDEDYETVKEKVDSACLKHHFVEPRWKVVIEEQNQDFMNQVTMFVEKWRMCATPEGKIKMFSDLGKNMDKNLTMGVYKLIASEMIPMLNKSREG